MQANEAIQQIRNVHAHYNDLHVFQTHTHTHTHVHNHTHTHTHTHTNTHTHTHTVQALT